MNISWLQCILYVALYFGATGKCVADEYKLNYQGCGAGDAFLDVPKANTVCANLSLESKKSKIEIPVVILKAENRPHADDVLIIIPGGPGVGLQTTKSTIEYWQHFFRQANRFFDVVLFSPRGTPGSRPFLACAELNSQELEIFSENISVRAELQRRLVVIDSCLQDFKSEDLPSLLSSKAQTKDIEELILLLPHKNVHLLADSWGTRIALQVHAPKLKTRVLDSSYPPGKGGFTDWFEQLDYRFDIYRQHFQDFDALWQKAQNKLKKNASSFVVETNLSPPFRNIDFVLNSQRLSALAFHALYQENLRQPFFEALNYVANEKSGRDSFNSIVQGYLQSYFDPAFSPLAWYASECVEQSRPTKDEFSEISAPYTQYLYFTDGLWELDPCQLPALASKIKRTTKINTAVPTLLLAGEFDPVTPRIWSEELSATLGNRAKLYTAPGAGHGILAGDYCSPELIGNFIKNPKLDPKKYCEML